MTKNGIFWSLYILNVTSVISMIYFGRQIVNGPLLDSDLAATKYNGHPMIIQLLPGLENSLTCSVFLILIGLILFFLRKFLYVLLIVSTINILVMSYWIYYAWIWYNVPMSSNILKELTK